MPSVNVQLVDPSAFTPPYDRSLAAALARAGADVELVTSHFHYGPVPPADGYHVSERFYRRSSRSGGRLRMPLKLAEHVPDMLRYRRHARTADVVHWQWLTVQPLDVRLLPRTRPQVLTAHDVLPREPRPGQIAATRRLVNRMDAVIAHSQHGAWRLREELAVPGERVHVIPHGVFDYLTKLPDEAPLPAELADAGDEPVVLFFGLLRPYKGLDVLLEAWREVRDAQLWIAGMPRMDIAQLRAAAPPNVRWVSRFVPDAEIAPLFRSADVVVLPYREIEQSGVLYTALAFGKPVVASRVGGFAEIDALRLVEPGDPAALADALRSVLSDPAERERLAAASGRAAGGEHSWDAVAARTLGLYRELVSATTSR